MGKEKPDLTRVANQFYGGNLTEAKRALDEARQQFDKNPTNAQIFQLLSKKRGRPKGETHWKRFGNPDLLDD